MTLLYNAPYKLCPDFRTDVTVAGKDKLTVMNGIHLAHAAGVVYTHEKPNGEARDPACGFAALGFCEEYVVECAVCMRVYLMQYICTDR